MKKLILIALCLFAFAASQAQTNTTPITRSDFYGKVIAGTVLDTIGATQTSITKTFFINQSDMLTYAITTKISDYTTGSNLTGTVVLSGRLNEYSPWVTLTTVTYAGAGTDSTITFSESSTAKAYYLYKLVYTRTAGKGKIDYVLPTFKK